MAIRGSVDIAFTNSTQIANEAKEEAGKGVKKGEDYNGVKTDEINGIVVTSSKNKVTLNATKGIEIIRTTDNKVMFKVDSTTGDVIFAGDISGASGTFSGDIRGGTIYANGTDGTGFLYTNAVDVNPIGDGVNVYIRPKSGGEVRFTATGTTGNFQNVRGARSYFDGVGNNTGTNLYLGTNGEVYATSVGMSDVQPLVWRPVRAEGFKGDYLDANPSTGSVHLYIRPTAAGEVRATKAGTTGVYVPIRASNYYAEGDSVFEASGYAVLRARGGYAYIQSDNEARVTKVSDGNTYMPIRASGFPTGSSVTTKTNVEPFSEEEALYMLDTTPVWTYHLIANIEAGIYDKPKIGLLAEGVPQKLRDEDGVDPYSIISTLFRVCQRLRNEIVTLTKRMDDLELI